MKTWMCSFFTPNFSHLNLNLSLHKITFISEFPVFVIEILASSLIASSPPSQQLSSPVASSLPMSLEQVPSFPSAALLPENHPHYYNVFQMMFPLPVSPWSCSLHTQVAGLVVLKTPLHVAAFFSKKFSSSMLPARLSPKLLDCHSKPLIGCSPNCVQLLSSQKPLHRLLCDIYVSPSWISLLFLTSV